MTEIERKVVKRAAELSPEDCYRVPPRHFAHRALWNALYCAVEELEAEKAARAADREQHEAFRQEVSDAVEGWKKGHPNFNNFDRFLLPKPDPLVKTIADYFGLDDERVSEMLKSNGLKIVEDK